MHSQISLEKSGIAETPMLTDLGNVISTNVSYVLIYSFLTVVAVASIVVIIKLKKKFQEVVAVESV